MYRLAKSIDGGATKPYAQQGAGGGYDVAWFDLPVLTTDRFSLKSSGDELAIPIHR